MNTRSTLRDLDAARSDATRSSGGGIAFLIAYGTTLLVAGLLAFVLPVAIAALVILFQGGVALPLAFALERRLGFPPMADDNPLRALSVQMALVQVVALPSVILVYTLNPAYVPAVFAAIGGGHFLPYAWLHRTAPVHRARGRDLAWIAAPDRASWHGGVPICPALLVGLFVGRGLASAR